MGLEALGASDALVGQCSCLPLVLRPPSNIARRFALVRRFDYVCGFSCLSHCWGPYPPSVKCG